MKKLAFVAFVVAAIWWWRDSDEKPQVNHASRVQTAVLTDGFAMIVHDKRQVIELDRDGAKQHEMPLRFDRELRLVGTRAGTAVGFQNGKKLELAILDSEGNIDDKSTWGKKVTQLCQGAATNEHRFGVGWLESDGRVWFVHGPMKRAASDVIEATRVDAEPAKVTWCGIASAETLIVLFWRDGQRLLMNYCAQKGCTDLVAKVPIDTSETVLSFGCLHEACLLATRDKHGTTKLHRVTDRGRAIVKTLENATADTQVSIVGAGRAFAVGYMAKDNLATVQRITTDLAFTNTWHFENAQQAPSLAWAGEQLLVALPSGDAHVVKLPR